MITGKKLGKFLDFVKDVKQDWKTRSGFAGPIWIIFITNLDGIGQYWTLLDHFGQVWNHSGPC